jgi:hypothetical protein
MVSMTPYFKMTKETACRVLLYKYVEQDKNEKTEEEKNRGYKLLCLSLISMFESDDTPPFHHIAPQWYLDWKEYQDNIDTEVEKS